MYQMTPDEQIVWNEHILNWPGDRKHFIGVRKDKDGVYVLIPSFAHIWNDYLNEQGIFIAIRSVCFIK